MAMGQHSIMVGKSYRTVDNEIRTVQSIDDGEVVYRAASGPTGPGTIALASDERLSIEHFADEAENEVSPGV